MANVIALTEATILEKIVSPGIADLTPEAARSLLEFKFDAPTTKRVRQLLQKNNRGTISADERIDLEKYLRVGEFLDLVHAKAKLSLVESKYSR